MMRQIISVLLMLCFLLILTPLAGCGLRYVEVEHPEKFNSARLIDPNHSPFKITKSDTDPNKKTVTVTDLQPGKIILEKPCRVNYRKWGYWSIKTVIVDGRLPNGKKYPVYIDSGCSGPEILLSDIITRENNLETLCAAYKNDEQKLSPAKKREHTGLCFLPTLEIGELTIQKPICGYFPWHCEFQVLGVPLWQEKNLFLGVSIMSRFKYICFDNTKMQLEFSYNQSFQPEESVEWAHYPFALRKEDGRIMVDIPIAGQTCNIYFDTCGAGTMLKPGMWEKIRNKITATIPKDSKFLSYQHGFLPCRKTIVKKLDVGNIVLNNTEISILPEDTLYLSNIPGYISIWTFKDTSVVLDFERKLLWIKPRK